MAKTPSNFSCCALAKKASALYGPKTIIISLASLIAGLIIVSSSLPIKPSSPACGFNPNTAKRGFSIPKSSFNVPFMIRSFLTIFSLVMWLATSAIVTCSVTNPTFIFSATINIKTSLASKTSLK